jgi:serine O-acetyltransferase
LEDILEDILIEYLTKFFGLYFISYPKEQFKDLSNFLADIGKSLEEDIQFKYPRYTTEEIADANKLRMIIQLDSTIEAVFLYRLERATFLSDPDHPLLPYLANLMKMRTGAELYYSTEIGSRFQIQHGVGIVIGPRNQIGNNFMIHQGVTIGQRHPYSPHEKAIIGNDVIIYAGAKVLGNVIIGNNVQIGANAVLTTDADSDSVYAGVPAQKIRNSKVS